MILVTGFGPFGEVRRNPSGALALALHGARFSGQTVVGVELPVAYGRGVDRALAAARSGECAAVIGLGVARTRDRVEVERLARNAAGPTPDVDGQIPAILEPAGPARVAATLDAEALALALGAGLSDDAGTYVCNAWLFRLVRGLPDLPVGFVHLPPRGAEPAAFARGLGRWWERRAEPADPR